MVSPALASHRKPEIERVTASAWKALGGAVIGYAMDGFDLLILGFILSAVSVDLALTSAQAGSLVTCTLIGAVAGGLVFGALSDHFGRIRVLTWTILLFAIFTGLCGLARGYWDLVFYRMIAGFGLGGEFGIGMALAAETWPARMRARASSYVAIGWQAGVLLAATATPILLPRIGWRGMFALGLLPAGAAFLVRRALDEPEIFVKKHAARSVNSFRLLVNDRHTTRTSAGIAILCSVQNFGYYGIMIWMPSYLATSLGFGLTKSAVWTAATVLGMAVGVWIFGELADRIGRKPILILFQAGSAIMVLIYSRLTDASAMLWAGALMGVCVNGMMGGLGALMSEAYPTAARATAQNVLFNIGRAVGGLGPLAIGAIAVRSSFHAAIALLAAIYVIDILATILLIPELRGKTLD